MLGLCKNYKTTIKVKLSFILKHIKQPDVRLINTKHKQGECTQIFPEEK